MDVVGFVIGCAEQIGAAVFVGEHKVVVGGLGVGFAGGVEALYAHKAGAVGPRIDDFNGLERQGGVAGDDVFLRHDVWFSGVILEGKIGMIKLGCTFLEGECLAIAVEPLAIAGFDGEIGEGNAVEIGGC